MKIRKELQLERVNDDVLAMTTLAHPILKGTLYAIKEDIAKEAGGYENLKLKLLPRMYLEGSGDCGICFEYAVHEAIKNNDSRVVERIADAAKLCNVKGGDYKSILFGLEKNGKLGLIDTANEILNDESQLLYGARGRPAKLKRYINQLSGAFKNRNTRPSLPTSISGLWKADLFVGDTGSDNWLGTTVKINPSDLTGAKGLRIGIVPIRQGKSDKVRKDDDKNLIICPLHHDHDFMQAFYEAWRIVQAFIRSDARMPKESLLPDPTHREVCRILGERREYPVVDVLEALEAFGQLKLIQSSESVVESSADSKEAFTNTLVAPKAYSQC